ncbi:MAG: hypothetical protein WBE68_11420 [Candidatus Nitrosopolaris sp.]
MRPAQPKSAMVVQPIRRRIRDQFGDNANLKPNAITDSNGNYRITLSGGSSNFVAVAAQFAGEGIGASQSGDKSVPAH